MIKTNQQNTDSFFVKAALLTASTLTVLSGAIISPSLPAMRAHFAGIPNVDLLVRLILTTPALFIVISSPLSGYIIDKYGRKKLLLVSMLLYAAAGSAGFLLHSVYAILISRALLGVSVSGIMTSTTTLIADYYEGQKRASFMGFQSAFLAFGGTVFLSLGGIMADINWNMPFLIYSLALPIFPLAALFLFDPSPSVIQQQEQPNPTPAETTTSGEKGKLPAALLVIIFSITFISQIFFYTGPTQLPFHLTEATTATNSQIGFILGLSAFFNALTSLLYGKMSTKISYAGFIPLHFFLSGAGYALIGIAQSYGLIITGIAVAGLGFGMVVPNLSIWITSMTPPKMRGRAIGMLTTVLFLGQFVSPIFIQPIANQTSYGTTFLLCGLVMLLLSTIFFTTLQFRKKTRQPFFY